MDIERARFNMVEQQIRTWDVLDQEILDLLFILKRENFVPPAYRSMAFTDMEIPLNIGATPTGEFMFSPKMEARLAQELALKRHETVLEVGAGSGYMAALLAHRAKQVLTLEILPQLAQFARENLDRAGMTNARVEQADATLIGSPGKVAGDFTQRDAWDAILLSGSVPFVPENILARLRPGGRLIAIVGDQPIMTARLFTRLDRGGAAPNFESIDLFETVVRPLVHFPQHEAFRF
jgi:protein-L-isoaspartate(D-aspartate) O-methyltransferase